MPPTPWANRSLTGSDCHARSARHASAQLTRGRAALPQMGFSALGGERTIMVATSTTKRLRKTRVYPYEARFGHTVEFKSSVGELFCPLRGN